MSSIRPALRPEAAVVLRLLGASALLALLAGTAGATTPGRKA